MRTALCLTLAAASITHAFADAPTMDMSPADMSAMQMNDDAAFAMLKFDEFEHAFTPGGSLAWKADAWYGADYDKLRLRSEGEHDDGRLDARIEAFWDHAFSTFWDWQLGARHDAGLGTSRDWAAFGVQGIAPFWFDVEATAYLGESGRTAFRIRTEYDLPITQRLIIQPEIEANVYGRDDPQREVGSGLSDAQFALRLRYEIRREVAPYVGVVWQHRFGDAAKFARLDGHDPTGAQLVAGIRFWF